MPANVIKSLANKHNKSEKEVEKLWKKAKKIASQEYDVKKDSDRFYALTMGVLKNMLGNKKESVNDMVESVLSGEDVVETITTSTLGISDLGTKSLKCLSCGRTFLWGGEKEKKCPYCGSKEIRDV